MTVRTSAGSTIGVSASAPATFNAAGYAALTYTLIGEVTDAGEFGREYQLAKHNPLASRATVKKKASFDEGSIDLKVGLDGKDAGQIILLAASTSDNDYYFLITDQAGNKWYIPSQVMSFKPNIGSVDNITQAGIKLEVTTGGNVGIVYVPAP